MSGQQAPPWLQEQIAKFQQSQQNLQSILAQKQRLEMEKAETAMALEELKKAADEQSVYKYAGSILVKSDKSTMISELEEKSLMYGTRAKVLAKHEASLKEDIKGQEAKINEMIKGQGSKT